MGWKELEITTTQLPGGSWRRVKITQLDLLTISIWRVELLVNVNDKESTEEWEFANRGDATVKYREVR